MIKVKFNIKPSHSGFEVRILKKGKLVTSPKEFTNSIDCLNHVNTYCSLNNFLPIQAN